MGLSAESPHQEVGAFLCGATGAPVKDVAVLDQLLWQRK